MYDGVPCENDETACCYNPNAWGGEVGMDNGGKLGRVGALKLCMYKF